MKKIVKILFCLCFLLVIFFDRIFAGNLEVEPPYLNSVISPGGLNVNSLHIINYSEVPLSIKTTFGSWMLISPAEFNLAPRTGRDITAIFFIPREEKPQRTGEITFEAGGEKFKVRVAVSTPAEKIQPEESEESIAKVIPQEEIREESNEVVIKKDLSPLFELFVKELDKEIRRKDVQLSWLKGDILIIIPGRIIFDSGKAYPKKKGLDILRKIGFFLKNKSESVQVDGHADSRPIGSQLKDRFSSNWELASTRSATATRILEYTSGIKGRRRLVASGYSFNDPIADNGTIDGRTENRRLEIKISASASEE